MNKEKWKWIEGWEGDYEVSTLGRVRSYKVEREQGRILSNGWVASGYAQVQLCDGVRVFHKLVHSLVSVVFIGKRPDGLWINHVDGNKKNNSIDNLEYVTPSENALHAFRTGLRKSVHGEKHYNATLSESDVREIKNVAGIEKQTVTARRHGVSQAHISMIQSGKCWGWLKDE